jgi:hypothetical protein
VTIPQIIAVSAACVVALTYLWPLIVRLQVKEALKHVAAIAVLVALLVVFRGQTTPPVPPPPASPITVALRPATKADRLKVVAFYESMADVIERDSEVIKSIADFRKIHASSLNLAFDKTELKGKYPGLDVAIDDTLVQAVGLDPVPLTPERRSSLVAALKGVADAARR